MEREFRQKPNIPYYDVVQLLSLMNNRGVDRQIFKEIVIWMIKRNQRLERYEGNKEELLLDIKDVVTQFREEILEVVNDMLSEDYTENNVVAEKNTTEDRNLTIEELRKFCGGVSRPTIDKWVKNGLKSYKVSGRVFFKLSEVQEYLSNHERK